MIYFTADEHYDDINIITYCNRPFKTVEDMNKRLIYKHNLTVNDDDTVYHIGDFSLNKHNLHIVKLLKGKHHLILGNHDKLIPWEYVDKGFLTVHTTLEINTEYGNFILGHDPSLSIINKKWRFLCGHVHDLFVKIKNTVNVGVDVWSYKPVSLNEINDVFKYRN